MKYYVVDAFADNVFKGNQAAVYFPENKWPSDEFMTNLCRENNFSDIALLIKKEGGYDIRWFTQQGEIEFCGHATMAASYVILYCEEPEITEVNFDSMHGHITAFKKDGMVGMTFDKYNLYQVEVTDEMVKATNCDVRPIEAWMDRDLVLVYKDEKIVKDLNPNMDKVRQLDGLLLHVTAPGKEYDCVSRSFAPKCDIVEDPVCGSGHCHIIPYWSEKFGKADIKAFQASQRTGVLYGHCEQETITIYGNASLFAKGVAINEDKSF